MPHCAIRKSFRRIERSTEWSARCRWFLSRSIHLSTPASGVGGVDPPVRGGALASSPSPACGCYFDNVVYWITFAGIATTDDPRYVVGEMMNSPARNADGSPDHSAAPLFITLPVGCCNLGPPLILQAT